MVSLALKFNEEIPEFLYLLKAVVKIEELNLPLKRNQQNVVKFMTSHTGSIETAMNMSQDER